MQPDVGVLRVLVLDEHEVVRRGVIQVLERDEGITVVGEAASAGEAVARGMAARPHVAVVGMRLPDGSGAEACARLRGHLPDLRCLVLSMFGDPETVSSAVRAGVSGYLLKDVRAPGLVSAVRRVAAGDTVFAQEVRAAISRAEDEERHHPLTHLTPRERVVLQLIGEGLSNRQIGTRLGLTEKTVKNHVSNLLPKLGVERRTQAAVLAARWSDRGVGSAPPRPGAPAARLRA